jgi:hypothetical protein
LNHISQPASGSEIILYRTHSEILTDRRLLVRGDTYRLDQIARVYVRPAGFYVPFLLVRLALLLATVVLLASFVQVAQVDFVPGNHNIHLFAGALSGLIVVFTTWIVPTWVLWMRTTTGQRQIIMRSGDAGYLRDVRGKIENAARDYRQKMA